jgi:hypothetical protein
MVEICVPILCPFPSKTGERTPTATTGGSVTYAGGKRPPVLLILP